MPDNITDEGLVRSLVVPSPIWPLSLLPQHFIESSSKIAQECESPNDIAKAVLPAGSRTLVGNG